MEKEKLVIRNFGPIKSVELELGRFNVLIGEQGTGKSTVAKVLAVCRYFSYIVEIFPEYHFNIFKSGLTAWGLSDYIKDDTLIKYSCKHYSVSYESFTYVQQGLSIDDSVLDYEVQDFILHLVPISIEFNNLLAELAKIKPQESNNTKDAFEHSLKVLNWTIPTSFYLNDVKKVMDNPFYLPTERGLQSIFTIGKSSIQNLSDALYIQFTKLDRNVRMFGDGGTLIEPLNIEYENKNGQGFVKKREENQFYSLFNAASGYQSVIPIVLSIKYYWEFRKKKTFLIEEPELNLFPIAQNALMQYLVNACNSYGHSFLCTTHSPYVLASINNCIYAYNVGQSKKEEVNEVLAEKYWLNPDDVSAYRLLPDGTAKNIIDEELKEIIVEELNGVSKEINAVYDRILDIKFGVDEASE